MKDMIVVVHATERKYLMDEYGVQLREAGIPMHVEPVTLPDGIGSMTMRWRLDYWRRMTDKFNDYQRIVFTDAWDVLFYGDYHFSMADIPHRMTISGERNCWPEPERERAFTSLSPWRFCNPGMMCGAPFEIFLWLNFADRSDDLDVMDQVWFNRHAPSPSIRIDETTQIFYVASADKEDGSLSQRGGYPFNRTCYTSPKFIHFAGPCHPDPFRAMLRGEVDAL